MIPKSVAVKKTNEALEKQYLQDAQIFHKELMPGIDEAIIAAANDGRYQIFCSFNKHILNINSLGNIARLVCNSYGDAGYSVDTKIGSIELEIVISWKE